MKRKFSIFSLLLICMLSLTLTMTLVRADVGGIGKYLTVEISPVGGGTVTAYKGASGEIWVFPPSTTEKVGAGTISLVAEASDGYRFVAWGGDLEGVTDPVTDYKTRKEGYVIAYFEQLFKITATAVIGEEGPDGSIPSGSINPEGDIWVEAGATPTFDFTTDVGSHISSILTSEGPQPVSSESYTFEPVYADGWITVCFDLEGQATVQPSEAPQNVWLGPEAGFELTSAEGGVIVGELPDFPEGSSAAILGVFSVPTDAGTITISMWYDPNLYPTILHVHSHDSLDALCCDVNGDGTVNGDDISDIANWIRDKPDWYNPTLDVDRDGNLDNDDVTLATQNLGEVMTEIDFTIVNGFVVISVGDFSYFRVF